MKYPLVIAALLTTSLSSFAGGVEFNCAKPEQVVFKSELKNYLKELNIPEQWTTARSTKTKVAYSLTAKLANTKPVDFHQDPYFNIRDEIVNLPSNAENQNHAIQTVSKREIVLALLHPGRNTTAPCDVQAFKDHVGIRQNIAAWAERLRWGWPEGEPAQWNSDLWTQGTPNNLAKTDEALLDAFIQQEKYSIGCYTATKLVVANAVVDYFTRVRQDASLKQRVLANLLRDNDPLVQIEPPAMWAFEKDFDTATIGQSGKLLKLTQNVAPGHFVPGDWAYFLNTDESTYQKTGYEGSNAIYLGRGKFDDYYNDHAHAYSYYEKLDEVYQWRNHVFNRNRDQHKIQPLSLHEKKTLEKTPSEKGLVLNYRATPYFYSTTAFN